jgi:alkanesulfonate monooxygenase SsuD/methylene tetrahydromethanopterin reductase-like flavin-dependent oxidoreductase (luciferase family)
MGAVAAALSEPMLDSLALIGPASRCLERIAEYRAAGAQVPIVVPNPVGEDYASAVRKLLRVFAKA